MTTEAENYYRANAITCDIPGHMVEGIVRYLVHYIEAGDFLTAVFENDLVKAAGRADESNLMLLPNYARFLYNYAPTMSWGSKGIVMAWLAKGNVSIQE